jgi:hypothetical protein
VWRNPIFSELDLHPEQGDENLIIDLIYDNMSPMRLQDLYRGTDIPQGVRFWPDWFYILLYMKMHDIDGRRVYPRAPGIHTVTIRTGRRTFAQMVYNAGILFSRICRMVPMFVHQRFPVLSITNSGVRSPMDYL